MRCEKEGTNHLHPPYSYLEMDAIAATKSIPATNAKAASLL